MSEPIIKDIPIQYFAASLFGVIFVVLFLLLGGVMYTNLQTKHTCEQALNGNLFYMCGGGCKQLYEDISPSFYIEDPLKGKETYELGCVVPQNYLNTHDKPGGLRSPLFETINTTIEG